MRRAASVRSRHHGGDVPQEWRTNKNAERREVRTALFTTRIRYQSTPRRPSSCHQQYSVRTPTVKRCRRRSRPTRESRGGSRSDTRCRAATATRRDPARSARGASLLHGIVGDIRPLLSHRRVLPPLGTARMTPLPSSGDSCQSGWALSNGSSSRAGHPRHHGAPLASYGQTTRAGGPMTSRREREGGRGLVVSRSRQSDRTASPPPAPRRPDARGPDRTGISCTARCHRPSSSRLS